MTLSQGKEWKGGESVDTEKACNGRFITVPTAGDGGTLETFPVYHAIERGSPKRKGEKILWLHLSPSRA